jgi:hypothetical protein
MTEIRLSSDEARLHDAYGAALSEFEAMAASGHPTASAPAALDAVRGEGTGELFVLCDLTAIKLAHVTVPDLIIAAKPSALPWRRSAQATRLGQQAREAQSLIDRLLAAGFVAGAAMAALRGEALDVDASTPIYPWAAIEWRWERASESIWEGLDADPVASDLLHALSAGDVSLVFRLADEAQRGHGQEPDPILSAAYGEHVARRGYALYWAHTKAVAERFRDEHMAWVARRMSTVPPPAQAS